VLFGPALKGAQGLPVAASATATTAAAASTTTTATPGLGSGFINRQRPPVNLTAVQHGDGLLPFQLGLHFYESEASGLTGLPVGDDFGRGHMPGLTKEVFEFGFSHFHGQIAHI
jgi:hypothetical protein